MIGGGKVLDLNMEVITRLSMRLLKIVNTLGKRQGA